MCYIQNQCSTAIAAYVQQLVQRWKFVLSTATQQLSTMHINWSKAHEPQKYVQIHDLIQLSVNLCNQNRDTSWS